MTDTKTRHTPGPWRVGGHPGDKSGTAWREVVTDALPFAPSYVCQALEADARLIAAAPAMLEFVEKCERAGAMASRGEDAIDLIRLIEMDARALLAKVRA